MSSLATTYVLDRRELATLVETARASGTDSVWDDLLARPRTTLDWSGRVMGDVLVFLDDHGVLFLSSPPPLPDEEREISNVTALTYIITPEARRYLGQLEPGKYSNELLQAHFDGYPSVEPVRDALRMLRDGIASLADDQVLLLMVS